MNFPVADNVKLNIPRNALNAVFDECDRYEREETGGRIVGTYDGTRKNLTLSVNGVIEPGPNASRTESYLKQDGFYQERVFRKIEEREPLVEHLGNWHTHHVNGFPHLSGGDIGTYRRTVEHHKHNTDFFYALLVIEKNPGKTGLQRYAFKNYVLRRGDPAVYRIPRNAITLTDTPLIWPINYGVAVDGMSGTVIDEASIRQNRVYDRDIVSDFFPNVKTFKSKKLGICWRGPLSLVDDSKLEAVVIEDDTGAVPRFNILLRNPPKILARLALTIANEEFSSCREALVATERLCNAELYRWHTKTLWRRLWMF